MVLNCKEISRIVASDELETLGGLKRFRVRFHLLICLGCRRYADQIRIMGSAAREKIRTILPNPDVISRLEKSILDNAFGGPEGKN